MGKRFRIYVFVFLFVVSLFLNIATARGNESITEWNENDLFLDLYCFENVEEFKGAQYAFEVSPYWTGRSNNISGAITIEDASYEIYVSFKPKTEHTLQGFSLTSLTKKTTDIGEAVATYELFYEELQSKWGQPIHSETFLINQQGREYHEVDDFSSMFISDEHIEFLLIWKNGDYGAYLTIVHDGYNTMKISCTISKWYGISNGEMVERGLSNIHIYLDDEELYWKENPYIENPYIRSPGEQSNTFQIGIRALQEHLVELNYLDIDDIDGQFGEKTIEAIKAFQHGNDLPVTGIVDPDTWRWIFGYGNSELDFVQNW